MHAKPFELCGRAIGPGHACFVIAEAGVNHNGSLDRALQMIEVAASAGADAVKFQTFKADRLVTDDAPKAAYQAAQTGGDETQLEMLKRLELTDDAFHQLRQHCAKCGVAFISTPFEEESADLLDRLGVGAFKIPSGEITNLPFLAHVASKAKPLIVSTGMCNLGEVEAAVEVIEASGNCPFVLLHCVSNYPADPLDVNLRAMDTLRHAFHVPVGYSDHTLGIDVSLAAVARGACVIEKHFTLDRSLPGPDHAASLEGAELRRMVEGIRTVQSALGTARKRCADSESNTASVARKSLVAARDLQAGDRLTEQVVACRRPGTGLPPSMKSHLLDRCVRVPVRKGTPLKLEMLA